MEVTRDINADCRRSAGRDQVIRVGLVASVDIGLGVGSLEGDWFGGFGGLADLVKCLKPKRTYP